MTSICSLLLFWFSGLHTLAHRRPTLLLPLLPFRSMTPTYHSSLLGKVCNYINPHATITLLCGSSELSDVIVTKLEMTTSQPGHRQLTSSDLGQEKKSWEASSLQLAAWKTGLHFTVDTNTGRRVAGSTALMCHSIGKQCYRVRTQHI